MILLSFASAAAGLLAAVFAMAARQRRRKPEPDHLSIHHGCRLHDAKPSGFRPRNKPANAPAADYLDTVKIVPKVTTRTGPQRYVESAKNRELTRPPRLLCPPFSRVLEKHPSLEADGLLQASGLLP